MLEQTFPPHPALQLKPNPLPLRFKPNPRPHQFKPNPHLVLFQITLLTRTTAEV